MRSIIRLEDYMGIVSDSDISTIYQKAIKLQGLSFVHINSTYYGGGVAEILKTLVPLMNDVGVDAGWRVLHGTPEFFAMTKKFHNSLQGEPMEHLPEKIEIFTRVNEEFSVYTHLDHDFVVVHDPQPLPLIKFYRKHQPWLWVCHIDLTTPHPEMWNYLKRFIIRYDKVVVSDKAYMNPNLPVEQVEIPPAIDPLSEKNQILEEGQICDIMENAQIPLDKPLITQVSRFDKWKDPLGVIKIFREVREKVDSRLVLCGSMASDDPEGYLEYEMVRKAASDMIESGDIITLVNKKDLMVNALQRASSVIVQKSMKEGFGLTTTESLWKGRPVVASNVGGIPKQIKDGFNGYLVDPRDDAGFRDRIIHLLRTPEDGDRMGENARSFIQKNYMITRLLENYLDLMSGFLEKHQSTQGFINR